MTEGTGRPSIAALGAELDDKIGSATGRKSAKPDGQPPRETYDTPPPGEIYDGCPVTALGVSGDVCFYLDTLGQLRAVDTHTKDRMRSIFGVHAAQLELVFPQFTKGGGVSGWSQEELATAMVRACSEKGVWNAYERVRGIGAWPDGEGGVILHVGQQVLHKGAWRPTGEIDGYVYPAYGPILPPLRTMLTPNDHNPGQHIIDAIATWRWKRRESDPMLMLGWLASAMFGGALDWRPAIWITGDAGTGKSTLQTIIYNILGGDGAVLQSTDATEAGLRQLIGQSTVPISLDEIEPGTKPEKVQAVVKLARQAASGGVVLRGGADHKASAFKARNSFVFSSILVGALQDQDISRITMLELYDLERGITPPDPTPKLWQRAGQALRTRILRQWPRLQQTLALYRASLSAVGHSARGCDQYGILLAMADLALHDDQDVDRCDAWAGMLSAEVVDEQSDRQSDWQRMLNHLFSQVADMYRSGERRTIGFYIRVAAGLDRDDAVPIDTANRALAFYGLRVEGRREGASLLIANMNAQLGKLFIDTQWYAPAGQTGVWRQAAKRVPGATAAGVKTFNLATSRATLVPLASVPHIFGDAPHAPPQDEPQHAATPEEFA